jgi:hypothetical protein
MKSSNLFKFKVGFFVLAALALCVMFAAGVFAIGGLVGGLSGASLAFAQPASATTDQTSTTETAAAASVDFLKTTISKKITEMRPAATPLDTIMREIAETVSIASWDYKWFNIDQKGVSDTVKALVSATGTTSPINTTHDLYVNNVGIWNVDDNIMFLDVLGAGQKPLIVHIVDKSASLNKLTIIPLSGIGNNNFDLPEIAVGKKIVRIGNAKAEKDAQTTPYAGYPLSTFNYCQIHMAQIEESVYQKLHDKEVNWNINDHKAQSLYDLRRSMELTSLFGVKGYHFDPIGGDYKYFSDGITRLITKGLGYSGSSITNDTFVGWGKDIFTGNSGSDKRVAFVGGSMMKSLAAVPTIQKQIEAKQTEVVWGIRFNKIDAAFGELLVRYHPLFDVAGYEEKAVVLDVNFLEKAVFKPMATRTLDLIGSGQKNANAQVIEEAFCIATRYPDLHAIISKTS